MHLTEYVKVSSYVSHYVINAPDGIGKGKFLRIALSSQYLSTHAKARLHERLIAQLLGLHGVASYHDVRIGRAKIGSGMDPNWLIIYCNVGSSGQSTQVHPS